ncbi:PREDICTED: uncharacterized protein LOC109352191 isoform X2 [Lupinus angustifolius]|uniref:uncharacterized protein LOC109352191 isoform X2 n=1 Tax=Lupinus angustifolius TaxID=3871 RepID=UPI00092F08B9|nr:PREDICTED: uncharacterized protein LOC109352191 isoform X2 [Lupinus angustifolius]
MGKEWYWASKSSKKGAEVEIQTQTQTENTSGCMCAFFQFFDFHPFHFPTINNQQQQTTFNSASYIQEDHNTIPKGAEAPRNSLESEGGTISFPSKEENFKIPKNIQIKTSRGTKTMTSGGNLNDLSNSPGIKTPTLVARLMGLDLLPHSPSSSSSSCIPTPNLNHLRPKQHIQTKPRNSIDSEIGATRSLPETPRISSARRSDVEYHHRLSLQINKENNIVLGEDLDLPKSSFSRRRYDENNSISPSHYARQIVKQVKESVARKVGQDITNTIKSKEQTKEEFLGQLRIKKSPKTSENSNSNHSSYSPRLRFMDNTNKHKQSTTPSSPLIPKDQNQNTQQPQLPRVLTKPKTPQQALLPYQEELQKQKSVPKCQKVSNEIFNSRIKRPPQTTDIIRNKQEESFNIIRPTSATRFNDIKPTKSKKTRSLSSNVLDNINSVPNVLPVKTDPSPPATKIPQKQASNTQESKRISQLSDGSSHKYKQEGETLATRESRNNEEDKPNGTASTIVAQEHKPEFQYITEILSRRTITTTKTVSFNQWFSLTHPLDRSIFPQLEQHHNDKVFNFTAKHQLGHRWNRKLLFELVDEVLLEIIRPRKCEKKLWFLHGCCWYQGNVEGLVECVWKRIEKFPCANCEVLEDIDGLIKSEDMEKVKVESEEGLEEEEEKLVAEIEGNIWDKLVHETIMAMDNRGKSFTSRSTITRGTR